MDNDIVLLERLGNGITRITLNTPPLNLMTVALNTRLNKILDEVGNDDAIRVVVLTGAGFKAFSAGADIKEFAKFVDEGTMVSKKLNFECLVLNKLANLPQPVIAALNGIALGGGLEMALCCDYILIPDHVKVGFPEISLGMFPGSGGLARLPKLVGRAKAKELIFFGEMITAKDARLIGLANEVLPAGEIEARAMELAIKLSRMPRKSLRAVKRGVEEVLEMSTQQGVQYSLELMSQVLETEDAKEGIDAFINKREAHFNM